MFWGHRPCRRLRIYLSSPEKEGKRGLVISLKKAMLLSSPALAWRVEAVLLAGAASDGMPRVVERKQEACDPARVVRVWGKVRGAQPDLGEGIRSNRVIRMPPDVGVSKARSFSELGSLHRGGWMTCT
jgi:hypothetical protein